MRNALETNCVKKSKHTFYVK